MEKKTFTVLGAGLAAMALGTIAAQLLAQSLVAVFAPAMLQAWWFSMACTALFYVVGAPLFWLFTRRLPSGSAAEQMPVRAGTVAVFYFICMGGLYLFNYVGVGVTSLLSLLLGRTVGNPLVSLLDGAHLALTVLVVGLLSPFFEELVFRKLLLDKLRPFGDKTAMWFTALSFGLFHMNFSQFFYATAIGLVLAYAALKTGNIKLSVALHILLNLTGSVVMPYLALSENPILLMLATIFLFLCIALSVVFVCAFRRRIHLNPAPYRFSTPITGGLIYANPGMLFYYLVTGAMFVLNTLLV